MAYIFVLKIHILKNPYKDPHIGGIYSQKQRLKTSIDYAVFIKMDLLKKIHGELNTRLK